MHDEFGHIQEVIVQNFRAKPDTPMGDAGEPGLIDLMSACAIARLVLGPDMNIQAPPNLSADYGPLFVSGINDWGGISPVTPDFINPEAPWPELGQLAQLCHEAGYELRERLTIYPEYVHRDDWLDPGLLGTCPRAVRCRRVPGGLMRPAHRTVTFLRRGDTPPALASEGAGFTDADGCGGPRGRESSRSRPDRSMGPPLRGSSTPVDALAIVGRGVGAWRVTVRHTGRDEDVLDALARTEAPFLRTTRERLREAVGICALPATCAAAATRGGVSRRRRRRGPCRCR